MKNSLQLNLKEYFWNTLNKITNTFSNLTVTNLGHGYIKCSWEISPIDNFRIDFSKSCFYAIRLFDVSNSSNKDNSTCIMKEIEVSKFQSSITIPIPINKGKYYFEFGYRKSNGEWRKLAYHYINLGYRIKKLIKSISHDNWFDYKKLVNNNDNTHEIAYQISLNKQIGGSENSNFKKDNT